MIQNERNGLEIEGASFSILKFDHAFLTSKKRLFVLQDL